jgi:hypothetical protein
MQICVFYSSLCSYPLCSCVTWTSLAPGQAATSPKIKIFQKVLFNPWAGVARCSSWGRRVWNLAVCSSSPVWYNDHFLLEKNSVTVSATAFGSVSRISDQGMESIVSAVSGHLVLRKQGRSSGLPRTLPSVINRLRKQPNLLMSVSSSVQIWNRRPVSNWFHSNFYGSTKFEIGPQGVIKLQSWRSVKKKSCNLDVILLPLLSFVC